MEVQQLKAEVERLKEHKEVLRIAKSTVSLKCTLHTVHRWLASVRP